MRILLLSKKKYLFLVVLLTLLVGIGKIEGATYYSKMTGNANAANTWGLSADGTGTPPDNFTTSGDIFILRSASTLDLSGNWTLGAGVMLQVDGLISVTSNNDDITINGTVIFTKTNTTQVSLSGKGNGNNFTLGTGATLITANLNGIRGTNCSLPTTASGTITLPTDANYEFNGATQSTLGLPATVINLTLSGSGTKTLSNAIIINGNFNSGSGVTIVTNNLALTIGGDFTNSGVALNAGSSTFTINGTATQSIDGFTTTGLVSMTKTGGTVTFQGNVNGAGLTINGSGGTLNLGTGLTHTFTGAWTRTNGTLNGGSSTLKLGSSFSGTGGTFTANIGTVEWNAAGAQTIAAVDYNNLVFSGSGVKSIVTGTSVTGNLSIAPTGSATASVEAGLNIITGSLTLGGFNKINGTWGGTGSGATNINSTYFAATSGIVTVTTDTRPSAVFSGLTASQSICFGTATVTLNGIVSADGPVYPENGETVGVTINGVIQNATISGGFGGFSINFNTATIPGSDTPYTITYAYTGGGNLKASVNHVSTALTVNPNLPASVSIAALPVGAICDGTSVTFTATPTNGGTTPTYQWYNGASPISGATSATYTSTTLANGNAISVRMTSNATCSIGSPATSSAITMAVYPTSIGGTASSSSSQVCYNTSTTLTLAGSVGTIQWQTKASGSWADISGANGNTYDTPDMTDATSCRAVVTSGTCSSSVSNTVEVGIDTEKPIILNCPANISVPVTDGLCSAVVNWTQPTASDNCTLTSFVSNLSPGVTIAVGTSTVTYTATDNSGNVETFSFTITVTDNIKPTISCPAGATVFCVANAPGYSTYTEFTTAGGSASDNCSLNTDSFTQLAENLSGDGLTLTRTYRIADMAGNTSTCSQVFTISQPEVIIGSLGESNTCIGGALDIISDNTGLNYQWQVSSDNGDSWTNIVGANSSSYSGNLVNQGDQYRLLVSETTDSSGVGCVTTSNSLTFREDTPPVFINGTLGNQTVCTLNGGSSAAVYNISLTNSNVTDNCTAFEDQILAYSISGTITESGTNLAEGRVFDLGTYNITYTVTDQAGKFSTHSSTIIVNQSPEAITISHSVESDGGTGIAPNQCGTYNYSVEASPEGGFNYEWKVYSGIGTSGAEITNGITLTNLNLPGQPASVQIIWTGDMTPGDYTIEATKRNSSNSCEVSALLQINLQNSFDLQVEPAGHDCKAEVDPETEFTISWTVSKLCGTTLWGFTWYLFNQDLTELPVNYTSVNNGTGSFSEISGSTKEFNTNNDNANVTNGHPYIQTVYTLFIVNTSDMNTDNNHEKFYLKPIPETSEISTD